MALLGRSEQSFLIGVGSFFGAHVAYIAAFLSVRGEGKDFDTEGLKIAFGLWLTAASSRVLDSALPQGTRRTLQAGRALFLISDSVLAVHKFLLTEPRPALE